MVFPLRDGAIHITGGHHLLTREDSEGDIFFDVKEKVDVYPEIHKPPDDVSPNRASVKVATSPDAKTPSRDVAGPASASSRGAVSQQPRHVLEPVWLWNAHANPVVGKIWLEFDPHTAKKLEAQFQKNNLTANYELNIMGKLYQINFNTMAQVNKSTKFERQIFRQCVVPKKPVSSDGRPEPRLNRLFPSGYLERIKYEAVEKVNWRAVTKFVRVYPDRGDYKRNTLDPIMMEPLGPGDDENPVVKLSCGCIFPQSSIEQALSSNPKCPKCSDVFLAPGAQPSGTMEIREKNFSCEGAEGCATIEIRYNFKNGIQNDRMLRSGELFSGTSRIVFVPSDANGADTLALLKSAFRHGHSFMVGDSVTTGKRNTTVWRIHQKTSTSGGAARHGWPDAGYLTRLQSECVNYGLVDLESKP
jgi:deltex-like protein